MWFTQRLNWVCELKRQTELQRWHVSAAIPRRLAAFEQKIAFISLCCSWVLLQQSYKPFFLALFFFFFCFLRLSSEVMHLQMSRIWLFVIDCFEKILLPLKLNKQLKNPLGLAGKLIVTSWRQKSSFFFSLSHSLSLAFCAFQHKMPW